MKIIKIISILILTNILMACTSSLKNIGKKNFCSKDEDCMLVQSSYCKTVEAIDKRSETEWRENDIVNNKKAKENKQTCKVSTGEFMDINNFKAVCDNNKCKNVFVPSDVLSNSSEINVEKIESSTDNKDQKDVTEYVSCKCCCPMDNPPEKCLYKSKGEKIEDIITRDKTTSTDCLQFGCTQPIKFKYCD